MSNCKNSAFECAKAKYASYGVDVEKAMERIAKYPYRYTAGKATTFVALCLAVR